MDDILSEKFIKNLNERIKKRAQKELISYFKNLHNYRSGEMNEI